MSNPSAASHSDAATFLIPGGILLGIAILTSVARFYSRYRPEWLLRWNDYVLAFSLLLTIAWFALVVAMYSYGRVIVDPRQASIIGPLAVANGVIWFCAMNMIRISMCLMILRLKDSRRWKWPLWSLIAVQIAMILSATSVNLAYCRPISAAWEANPDAVCLKPWQMKAYAYTYNSFNIASDFTLSLIPLAFIAKMHRPKSEKILIGFLMATGLIASVFGVLRLVILLGSFQDQGMIGMAVRSDLLCGLELMVAIIAASLPCLKAPTQRVLHHFGVLHSSSTSASYECFEQISVDSHIRRQIEELSLTQFGSSPGGSKEPGRADV
ncbi:hypothetical protein GGP41_001043 [Bipolaris sorokiniana]|uniref:Rhodopsin domain-containing protein n=1 Tax=Cochliobolus sativus TaxID=45130 RepID=A0A8H5Z9Y2_COCSA|nr:hypothetical protein GGP41_001043 [Bipolaris sorokiniana]